MDNNNNKRGPNVNNKKPFIYTLVAAILFLALFSYMTNRMKEGSSKEITYNQFLEMLENGEIKRVDIKTDRIIIHPVKNENINTLYDITYYTGKINDEGLIDRLNKANVVYSGEVPDATNPIIEIIVVWVLPFVAIYIVMWFLFKMISKSGGGMMGGVGKSNAKVYVEKETGVTFKDVAGQEEAKESLKEIVDFLHNPGKYTRIGAKLPKGALLVEPSLLLIWI